MLMLLVVLCKPKSMHVLILLLLLVCLGGTQANLVWVIRRLLNKLWGIWRAPKSIYSLIGSLISLRWQGYSDSDFGGCPDDHKSTSGCFYVGCRSFFMEKCQIVNYNHFIYGSRICGLLWSHSSGHMVEKLYFKISPCGEYLQAFGRVLW